MQPRYYFVLPDMTRPVGGHTIQYMIADTLLKAGYDIALIHGDPRHVYPFAPTSAPTWSSPGLAKLMQPDLVKRLKTLRSNPPWQRKPVIRSKQPHPPLRRSAQDVFVLPEFAYCEYARLFPDAPLVLAAQDAFGLGRAYSRDMGAAGTPLHTRFRAAYTTSRVSYNAVETLLGRNSHLIGLPVESSSLAPAPKKFQIAYMPRKRQEETSIVVTALQAQMGETAPDFIPIANMTNEERDRTLRESLFFLSFSKMEGFGLPPAEAMSAGCIVIGYTGVGGNEYFTPETGFPIQDGDIIGFIETARQQIKRYRTDPTELDALRLQASVFIRKTYDPDNWHENLRRAWQQIDETMRQELNLSEETAESTAFQSPESALSAE